MAIWLNMVVEQGLLYGHYLIGQYYAREMYRHSFKLKKMFYELKKNNVLQSEREVLCISALSTKDYKNIYIYYVLQYVRARSYLKRALLGGQQDAQEALNELNTYKIYIHNSNHYKYYPDKNYMDRDLLQSDLKPTTEKAFNSYSALAEEDDILFEKIGAIVDAVRLFNKNNHSKKVISVVPEDLDSLLLEHINNNDIDEYKLWVTLLIDEQQISRFHMLFCERAIEKKRLDALQKLFMLESFNINSVITKLKMTPLEFLVDQGDLEGLQQLLSTRKDLDINLNNPLLKAVLGEQADVVALLLSHPDIDVNASKALGGANALWLAAKHGLLDVVQELLMHPKLKVNYQCSKLCAKETEFLKEIGKDKMNVREVALCYQHQEVIDLLQAHKQTLLRRRAAEQQQNVHAAESAVNATNGFGDHRPANLQFLFANRQQQQKSGDLASRSPSASQESESDSVERDNVAPMSPPRAKLGT